MGPKLKSLDIITVIVSNDDKNNLIDVKSSTPSYVEEKLLNYTVLKSGILVPLKKNDDLNNILNGKTCNENVYRSLKHIYYVKSFKNILIPADILHAKTKEFNDDSQKEIYDDEPKTDDVTNNADILCEKKTKEDENIEKNNLNFFDLIPTDSDGEKCDSTFNPRKKSSDDFDTILQKYEKEFSTLTNKNDDEDDDVDNDNDNDIIDSPDKTCNGEITLFLLNNNGVLKRIKSDPYLPSGLHHTFYLTNKFTFQPDFSKKTESSVTYLTGENGDLIPYSSNRQKITAEVGQSVSFMLSKNGGLFPVLEEKNDKYINYYFNGRLIHKSCQFSEIHSNSTAILINDKKFKLFMGENDEDVKDNESNSLTKKTREQPTKTKKKKKHHLRKREAYYNSGYEKAVSNYSPSQMESQSMRPIVPQSRITEYKVAPTRNSALYPVRQTAGAVQENYMHGGGGGQIHDAKYSESVENYQRPTKVTPAYYDNPVKSNPPLPVYSDPNETVERHVEEVAAPTDSTSPAIREEPVLRARTDIFIFDEKGTRIRLIPEITDKNDVIIYKLTCKGNLVRYPPCKEPEFGFEINFQLLLDEFVLVPTVTTGKSFHMTYILQENGDLIPSEENLNTFRKAPGSLIYYMLGKNNILFPVQQVVDPEGNVSFFYQDYFLLKMKDSVEKPLHFSTKGSPIFAFFNGLTIISMSSKPRLSPRSGSNWKHLKPNEPTESLQKSMYLTGPKGELIKIVPYKNRHGATVIYELDCNGILYRSPKDKKKCIILKSYVLLKEGILLPSNETNGYVYMMSKNGDLFPYLYPDGKIEAPLASSLKYVLCEKGILLPIKLEIIDNSICYTFRDVIVYKERVYCRSCLDRLDEQLLDNKKKSKKGSCDLLLSDKQNISTDRDIKLFVNKNGDFVFYEKQNKLLKRFPPELVPSYLKYTMGSFDVKSDGSLHQIQYQDPNSNVVNLMLEPNGDLLEDTRNVNTLRSDYYVLDAKGNLISVTARKTKKNWYFFKGLTKVCKVPAPPEERQETDAPNVEQITTPLGKDPLNLMEDPSPLKENPNGDTRSLYIPIPLKSVSVSNQPEACLDCGDPEHKKKCDMLKDTLNQVSKGNSLPLALELELTDEIIEELKNWAAKCDKVLSRREIQDELRNNVNQYYHRF